MHNSQYAYHCEKIDIHLSQYHWSVGQIADGLSDSKVEYIRAFCLRYKCIGIVV